MLSKDKRDSEYLTFHNTCSFLKRITVNKKNEVHDEYIARQEWQSR